MKKSLFCAAALLLSLSASFAQDLALARPSDPAPAARRAALRWTKTEHKFGDIKQSAPVTATFEFKNTGSAPVLITQVQASCGCTATEYTKEAVAPGKTARITATYNAANPGAFNKTVTVTTSADATPQVLTMTGTVVAAAPATTAVK